MTRPRTLRILAIASALLATGAACEALLRWVKPGGTRVAIVLTAPDQGREGVLQATTIPAEQALRGWSAVRSVRSLTEDGQTRLDALTDVDETTALLGARRRLMASGSGGTIQSLAVSPGPRAALDVAIVGGDVATASAFAVGTLAPALQTIDGGDSRVEIYGAVRLVASVEPRAADLTAHDLTAGDLMTRLCTLGMEQDAGRLRDGATVRPLVVRDRVRSLAELAAVQIPANDRASGRSTLLTDLARIEIAAADDGSAFRVGSEAAVLVRIFGPPGVSRRSIDAIGRLSVPRPLRILTRVAGEASELGYETLSPNPSREAAAEALRALPGAWARDSWSLWIFDERRHAATYAAASLERTQWRGKLWLASATARGDIAQTAREALTQHGLRVRPRSGNELWLSAPDPLRLRALVGRARDAEASEKATELRESTPLAPRVLSLRAELGVSARAAIANDLEASFGRRECGQVEIPGIASAIELVATAVPRTELLPVRPFTGRATVPLGAVGDLLVDDSSFEAAGTRRWDGWPAMRLTFEQPDAAQRIARTLVLGPAERAQVEAAPASE